MKPKTRHHFAIGGPFAIAGVWDSWGLGEKKIASVAMIATRASSVLEPIHDRMPVILHPSDEAMWLDEKASEEDLLSLLVPYDGEMTASLAPKGE